MKTANLFKFGIVMIAVAGLTFTGCKKDKITDTGINTQSMQQLTKDEVNVTQASDDALNDANAVLSGANSLKSTGNLGPCNATIDSTSVVNDSITYHITYHGMNCSHTRDRQGQVEITKKVGQFWGEQGASTIVRLINLRITKVISQKSMTLNGTKVFTNVSGGYLWQIGVSHSSIVHRAVGFITAKFDDNTTRVWNINRQRTFTGTIGGQLVMTIDGFGSADGYTGLVVWGLDRAGEAFYAQIEQSVVIKETCDWDPVSGVKIYQIPSDQKKSTVTYGYDNTCNLISSGTCPTNYKVDWQKGTHSGTFCLPLQ